MKRVYNVDVDDDLFGSGTTNVPGRGSSDTQEGNTNR
jgi:hypothetical protein